MRSMVATGLATVAFSIFLVFGMVGPPAQAQLQATPTPTTTPTPDPRMIAEVLEWCPNCRADDTFYWVSPTELFFRGDHCQQGKYTGPCWRSLNIPVGNVVYYAGTGPDREIVASPFSITVSGGTLTWTSMLKTCPTTQKEVSLMGGVATKWLPGNNRRSWVYNDPGNSALFTYPGFGKFYSWEGQNIQFLPGTPKNSLVYNDQAAYFCTDAERAFFPFIGRGPLFPPPDIAGPVSQKWLVAYVGGLEIKWQAPTSPGGAWVYQDPGNPVPMRYPGRGRLHVGINGQHTEVTAANASVLNGQTFDRVSFYEQ